MSTVWHIPGNQVIPSAESSSVWTFALPRLRDYSRLIHRLFLRPGFAVTCRVEVKARPSLRRRHTTHESISVRGESLENSIIIVRGQKVILDRDLARLYGVSTKVLNQAVKRNPERFPSDFMFQLTIEEVRSQNVTLKKSRGKYFKYRPYAFTEHGILMLSGVLRSERAIQVSIQIMRTFIRQREMCASNAELTKRVDALERSYDSQLKDVFKALRLLMKPPVPRRKPIGF